MFEVLVHTPGDGHHLGEFVTYAEAFAVAEDFATRYPSWAHKTEVVYEVDGEKIVTSFMHLA